MCITEEKLVDRYVGSNPNERFMLIYKNYEVFLNLIESYETGLFNRILMAVVVVQDFCSSMLEKIRML